MKKIFLSASLCLTLSYAQDYTQEDRIRDMQIMAKAMQNIQNGFFYNNFDMIKLGGIEVADTIMKVEPPLSEREEKDVMTRFMNNKVKMTQKIQKKIKRRMQKMIERFAKGDKIQALQNFMNVTKDCMSCHKKLRKW
jgi:hypothetical protein